MANATQSRRRPWPYDAYVGTTKVMLVPNEQGNLLGRKTRTLDQSAPTTFEYSSADPRKERTFPWSKLFSGLGQGTAPTAPEEPKRYSYAVRADCSINGLWMKGPNFEDHEETVHASAGEVRQFVKALHSGSEVLFAVCENGVYRRTADGSWTASLTAGTSPALPAGQYPQQAVRFKARGAGAIDALYLGTATGNIWQYTGSAWVQASSTAGPGIASDPGECRYVEKVGDELWAAGDYWIAKAEEDPLVRAKWSGVIYVGDQSSKITWLKQVGNTLIIFKTDGIYTISTEGVDQELFPTLRGRPNESNGKNAAVWIDKMWVPFGDRTYTLDANGELTPDGLEQLLENTSDVRGRMVAGAGHNTWFFYEVYYNSVSGVSHLVKHGTWVDDGTGRNVQFLNTAHHGSLAQWSGRATSCEIVPDIHASGNDRLYVGFDDGTLAWCVLPKNGPNPAADSNCEFTALDSYVYLPIHHSSYQADNKLYRGVSAFGPYLTNSEWAEVEYRLDLSNSAASWVSLDESDPKFTVSGQRKEFPTSPSVYGRAIQFRIKLAKNSDPVVSPAELTPILEGVAVHEQIRPAVSLEYTLNIDANSFAVKRNGTVDRRRGSAFRDAIYSQLSLAGPVVIRLADGTPQEMTIIDYQEVMVPNQKRRDLQWAIQVTAIQLQTLTQNQVSSGLTYATLEQYTVGELEAIL